MLVGLWGISVPLAWVFGFRWPDGGHGLVGVWWGLIAGYLTMTLSMCFFVLRSDWELYANQAKARAEMEGKLVPLDSDHDAETDPFTAAV